MSTVAESSFMFLLSHVCYQEKRSKDLYLKGLYDCVYRYIFNESTTDNIIGEINFKSLIIAQNRMCLGVRKSKKKKITGHLNVE